MVAGEEVSSRLKESGMKKEVSQCRDGERNDPMICEVWRRAEIVLGSDTIETLE